MLSKNALSENLFTIFLRARGLCREVTGILTYIQYAPVPELRPSLSDGRSWQIVVRRVSRHLTSSNRNRIGIQRYRLCGFVQRLFHLIAIQLLLPGRDDDSGDAIADKIGDRAPIGHKRSMPSNNTIPERGTVGTTDKVAANVIKPAPATPLAPLEVSMATARSVSCCMSVRSVFVACAMNSTAIVI